MSFRKIFSIALAAALFGITGTPAKAAQLYDMNQFLNQGHPFASPVINPTVYTPRPAQPAAPVVKSRATPAPAKSAAPMPSAPATETSSGMLDGVYMTLNLQGGYSTIGDEKATNITDLIERRGQDWVGGNSAAIGYDWKKFGVPLRTETEFFIRYRFDLDYRGTAGGNLQGYTNEVATFGGMVNVYHDLKYSWRKIRPFVGAGVGIARHWSQSVRRELDTAAFTKVSQDTRTNALTWAAMLGLNYEWKKNWLFRAEGRYQDFGEVESGPFGDSDTITGQYTTLDLLLGVMYKL